MGQERDNIWYDAAFTSDKNYHLHFTKSRYYGMWQEVIKEIAKIPSPSILDVCCGPGQFGAMLEANGYLDYLGIDFSRVAIQAAKKFSAQKYDLVDVWEYDFPKEYNTIVFLECLEHLDNDIDLVKKVEPGKNVILTVPKFDGSSHVRFFKDGTEALNRYKDVLANPVAQEFNYHIMVTGVKA